MSDTRLPTRAETARLRRTKQNEQRMKQTSERVHRPIAATNKAQAVKTQTAMRKPRRYQIAMGMPAMRLTTPRMTLPDIRIGDRMLSLFLTLMFALAIYLLLSTPFFRVGAPQVFGNARINSDDLNAALAVTNQPVFTLSPDELATRLRLNYPELDSVQVTLGLPNQVWVSVSERQPVILWQQNQGFTWIDSTGVAFRPRGDVAGLITVVALSVPPSGVAITDDPLSPPPFVDPNLVGAIKIFAPSVPAGMPMIYDARSGLGWEDPRGWKVFFGSSPKDVPLKVRVYQALVDTLIGRGVYPALINVAYPDAPYYRMEP